MAALTGPLRARLQGKKVGIVVCGANIDAMTYSNHLKRGLRALDKAKSSHLFAKS
jgi:threonine dehydratase